MLVCSFDGGAFKLEKLHHAFKSLKHKRVPGESNGLTGLSGAYAIGGGSSAEAYYLPPPKVARTQAVNRPSTHAMPDEVEKIDIGGPENAGNFLSHTGTHTQALRAQVNGSRTGDVQFEQGAQGQETSSSCGESISSGSSSASGSWNGSSSSSESEGSDDGGGADSASSAGDIDIF